MAIDILVSEITVLHLAANNDANGNPRRVYVLVHPVHGVLSSADEGYSGSEALNELGLSREIVSQLRSQIVGRIHVPPSEYKQYVSRVSAKERAARFAELFRLIPRSDAR